MEARKCCREGCRERRLIDQVSEYSSVAEEGQGLVTLLGGPCHEVVSKRVAHIDRVAVLVNALRITGPARHDRLSGYTRAVEAFGLEAEPDLVISGESDEDIAEREVRKYLQSSARADALIVSNNQMAIGALRAIRELGLSVPDDIAVASFDDFEGADLLSPGLTVVRQDVDALASSAVRLLLRRISKPERKHDVVVTPTTFIHRGSCGCDYP